MRPILLEIGIIPLRSYGLAIAIGFLFMMFVATRLADERKIARQDILDALFLLVVSAIIGARTLYVIINYRFFLDNPLDVFKVWNGGIVFYGGLIAVIASFIVFFKKRTLAPLVMFDIFAVSLPLGHAFGRVGCFFAGCCYGKPVTDHMHNIVTSNPPWYAVNFPHHINSFAPSNAYLHTTQLYAATYNFFIFLFLFVVGRRIAKKDGDLFWWYLVIYPIFRSINESFRGDAERKFFIDDILSLSQGISIPIVLLALYMIFGRNKNATKSAHVLP